MADELVDGLYSIKCVSFSLYSLIQHEESLQNNLNKSRYFNNSRFQSLRALFCILQENEMRGSSPPERRSNINLKLFFRRLRVLFRAPMILKTIIMGKTIRYHVSVLNYSRSFGAIFRLAELVLGYTFVSCSSNQVYSRQFSDYSFQSTFIFQGRQT